MMQRARLRDPCVAADAAGKLGQLRVELVDVALAPARDLPIRRDAELVQHAFDHGTDADDELQVVRRAGRIEQRRRRIVLDIDDDLPIARGFGARVGELAEEPPPVFRERAQLRKLGERRRLGGVGSGRRLEPLARADSTMRPRSGGAGEPRSQYVAARRARAIRDDDADRERNQREQRESVHGALGTGRCAAGRMWDSGSRIVCDGRMPANRWQQAPSIRLLDG